MVKPWVVLGKTWKNHAFSWEKTLFFPIFVGFRCFFGFSLVFLGKITLFSSFRCFFAAPRPRDLLSSPTNTTAAARSGKGRPKTCSSLGSEEKREMAGGL